MINVVRENASTSGTVFNVERCDKFLVKNLGEYPIIVKDTANTDGIKIPASASQIVILNNANGVRTTTDSFTITAVGGESEVEVQCKDW